MKQGDLVRVTSWRTAVLQALAEVPVIGIITKELGKFGVDTWFNVRHEGVLEPSPRGKV